jgi:hypothetical protein
VRPWQASSRAIWVNSAELPALRKFTSQWRSAANFSSRGKASFARPPPAVGLAKTRSGMRDEAPAGLDTDSVCCRSRQKLSIASARGFAYQSSFTANCTCRAVVDVLVIAPAVPDTPLGWAAVGGVKTIRFGVLKFARFKRLKISARNCRFIRS